MHLLFANLHVHNTFHVSFSCYIFHISRYLLLVIYAFFNMNDQGWGTREAPKEAEDPKAPTASGGTAKARLSIKLTLSTYI